jgi:uncharacterized membrane protein SpoIIM required for sporulation
MRETDFIRQNKAKWDEFEKILASDKKDPDKLSNLFIQVSDDLSYSRTFYRNRSVRIYLNTLAQQIFSSLYKNKKTRTRRFGEFWKEELPQLVWTSRRAFLISFLVFVLSTGIGIFSCIHNPEFLRVILGDDYVNMTIANIKKHDPMAVYKEMHQVDMFFGIAVNNLLVSVKIFLFGLVFSIGSVGYIAFNGIMLGAFQYFFYEQGLLAESALTIWMHGTLEMSAMVVAGAAGITMGNGLVFPKTYSRSQSFMISARRGLKILLGIVPIVVLAAIIESFVTRYTELPNVFRICVIGFSLAFILGYFVWLPWRKSRAGFAKPIHEAQLRPSADLKIDISEIHSNGEIFKDVFSIYRKRFRYFFYSALVIAVLYTLGLFFFSRQIADSDHQSSNYFFITELFNYSKYPALLWMNLLMLTCLFLSINYSISKEIGVNKEQLRFNFRYVLKNFWKSLLLSGLINAIILLQDGWTVFLLITTLPFIFLLSGVMNERTESNKNNSLNRMLILAGTDFWKFIGLFYLLSLLVLLFFFVIDSPFVFTYFEIISWNFLMNSETYHNIFIAFVACTSVIGLALVLPIIMAGMSLLYYSLSEIRFASSLRMKISNLGNGKGKKETSVQPYPTTRNIKDQTN